MTRSGDFQEQSPCLPESWDVSIPLCVPSVPKPYQPVKSEQKFQKSAVGQAEDLTFQMLPMSSFLMLKTGEESTEGQESEN